MWYLIVSILIFAPILTFIRLDCCLVECHSRELLRYNSCNIYAFWRSVFTATNTTAVQICLLVECCCKMDACWVFASQSCMLAGVAFLYLPYLLVWCLTISRACWCDASLLPIPSDVMPHYKPCLLVWYLIINHVYW